MAWIPSHQTLRDHRKVKRAARQLNLSIPTLIGHLHLLWWWALDQAPDGDLSICDEQDIADAMMYDGNALQLRNALVACGGKDGFGFLKVEDGRLIIHDWADYGGKYLVRKEQTRARVTRYRVRCNALVTPLEEKREEKIREENIQNSAALPPKRKPAFVAPTEDEAESLFRSRGFPGLGVKFVAHYQSQGWKKNGGSAVTDWQACVTTWIENQKSKGAVAVEPPAPKETDEQAEERLRQADEVFDKWQRAREKNGLAPVPTSEERDGKSGKPARDRPAIAG